ncbi:MAG: Octanoate-[acyl-carrier-protein]-protein-N-octanoyltransferase [Firmicutes bacterium]|nr:Octanoate-[acyl-carrier-protein]-protein-N-octanoyltransferase [Bacillota bacterium]MDI6704821.1 lipoyl(octanoyl) transferase LipB [Bacillota bacterium]
MRLLVSKLGKIDYREALELQYNILKLRQQGQIDDTLLLLEHFPVLTLGVSGKQSNILIPEQLLEEQGINVYRINRGGDITYHGPGQIVGYPLLDLNHHGRDLLSFIRKIEEVFIQLLMKEYRISAGRIPKHTGVWVGNEKITAIGFAVKRWVTMHGFAFNVNTNLDHFKWINPCGITDKGVTSMQKLLGYGVDLDVVMDQVIEYFCKVFDMEHEIVDIKSGTFRGKEYPRSSGVSPYLKGRN